MRRMFVSTAILVAAAATQALGQSQPARRDTTTYYAKPVTVSAARPSTTPGGASTIEAALDSARVQPAPTLEQVLREMPLVVVRANSRGEAQPSLRGGEDRQIAVLVDGVPITLSWDHRSDLSVVPLTAARGVTLHRGLASLLMGPNALGGAIEVDVARGRRADVRPAPWMLDAGVDHTGARSAALTGGLQRGSDAALWTVRGGVGYRGTEGAALAHGLERADAATRSRLTGDGDLRLNTDAEAVDGFVSLRRAATAGTWTSLTAAAYRVERGVAPEAHTVEPRLWRYPLQARGLAVVAGGTGMRSTGWGRGDLEASIGVDVGHTKIDEYDGLDYRNIVGGERDDDRTLTARLLGDHTLGARGDLRAAFTYADISHDEVLGSDPSASYRQRLWSLAGETDWRVPLGVPVRLSFGAAADGADTPESSDKPPLEQLWDWGGRAGATAALRKGTLLAHGSSSRRARFPALRELYSGALGRFEPNPGLRPEVEWVNEVGMTVRHARGKVQLVGFHQLLDDGIARISVATPAGNRFKRVNQGRITGSGIEWLGDATFGPTRAGSDFALQRIRGRDATNGDTELEYEPAFHGSVWCETAVPWQSRFGFEVRGTSEQRFIDLDSGSLGTLPPTVSFDVRLARGFALASAGPWQRLDAVLAVENLADQTLFDQAGLPRAGRTVRVQARLW